MKYICLIYHDEQKLEGLSSEELRTLVDGCGEWIEQVAKNGHHVFSAGLQSFRTAATLRSRGEKVAITDGPYAETKEYLGGVIVLDARDLNEAVQLASTFPAVRVWTIEVRPVMDPDAVTDRLDQKLAVALRANSTMKTVVSGSAGKELRT